MRILHVLHRSVPGTHGYAVRSHEIVTKQRDRGLEPMVVTSPSQAPSGRLDAERSEYIDGVRYFRSCSAALPPTAEVSDRSQIRSTLRLLQNVLLLKMVWRVTAVYRPAVIHAHSPFTCGLIANLVGSRLHTPTVYEMRGIWEESHAQRHEASGAAVRYRVVRFLEQRALQGADRCCVIGESLKDEVISRGIPGDKISVIPNGVDTRTFAPGPPDPRLMGEMGLQGKIVLGYIGSFSRYEGLEMLISLLNALAPEFSDLRLLLVGDGDLMPALRSMAARGGMAGKVIFTGRVTPRDIPEYYRLCDFLVLPRIDVPLAQVVTPIKPLEIMAMQKPLIASDIGGHREIVRDELTGLLFRSGDKQDLEAKCRRVIMEKEFAMALAGRARKWVVAEREWEVLVERYANLYSQLAAPRTSI